ncbi:condensation domain-containing protein [Rhizobium sp. BK251]|uniref:condensation domain-containing protein n=1 Tax=Rhizobium sp. BK251 TaxID=2512125 RepID=UPI0010E1AE9C|nr:condensation domain-containing protein [Rhizobium sp. BK251]TCL70343.1 condensation domain-containing protein [Rhizobium sp. BK251]
MSNDLSYATHEQAKSREQDGRYLRALGAHERLLHHISSRVPRHFCVVAEIVGAKSPEDYRTAIDMVQRRHPLLSAFVEDVPGRELRFRRSDRQIPITFIPQAQEPNWRRIVEQELPTPFSDSEAPLMRVTVLHAAAQATVIITLHHVGSDGLSGAYIVQDLLEALDGRALSPLPLVASVDEVAEKLLSLPGEADEDETPPLDASDVSAPASDEQTAPPRGLPGVVTALTIGEALATVARRACRANGTTLHGAVCAAMALAAGEIEAKEGLLIMTPISHRTVFGLDRRDCALMISVSSAHLMPGATPEFWQLARQVTDGLAQSRSPHGILAATRAMNADFPGGAHRGPSVPGKGVSYDVVASNLGSIAFPTSLNSVWLKAFWGPIIRGGAPDARAISLASVGGQLRMTETVPPGTPSILDLMRRKLVHECAEG